MPTIIALDASLSMQRFIPGRSEDNALSYHQLAVKGIYQFLDHLTNNSKLEFAAYLTYSSDFEVRVDFTRDYDQIRQAVKKLVHFDSSSIETMLKGVNDILTTNWATQNLCQVVVFTDCGLGFGVKSLPRIIQGIVSKRADINLWLSRLTNIKLNIMCMGVSSEYYFEKAIQTYQTFLDASGLKGMLFLPKCNEQSTQQEDGKNVSVNIRKNELGRTSMYEMIEKLCESSYKPFEMVLKCGSYLRMESPVLIWPPPPMCSWNKYSTYTKPLISLSHILVCGYINLSDIGSPTSISRHLIVPKVEKERPSKRSEKSSRTTKQDPHLVVNEFEKLENEIRLFYFKTDGDDDEDIVKPSSQHDNLKESICVLLHGALKVENMAALVLLTENWFGFIYPYADSKKKSNLLLSILPQGSNVIPWLGDLRMFGMADDVLKTVFPVKSERRSYSQNFVTWIKHSSLQCDIQKVLRHAKKIPEKTQHFYKELNRIRRAALSIGFIELMEILANIFEREIAALPSSTNPECILQLKHSMVELRKTSSRDLKSSINPIPCGGIL